MWMYMGIYSYPSYVSRTHGDIDDVKYLFQYWCNHGVWEAWEAGQRCPRIRSKLQNEVAQYKWTAQAHSLCQKGYTCRRRTMLWLRWPTRKSLVAKSGKYTLQGCEYRWYAKTTIKSHVKVDFWNEWYKTWYWGVDMINRKYQDYGCVFEKRSKMCCTLYVLIKWVVNCLKTPMDRGWQKWLENS